jgi:hypothetical protein
VTGRCPYCSRERPCGCEETRTRGLCAACGDRHLILGVCPADPETRGQQLTPLRGLEGAEPAALALGKWPFEEPPIRGPREPLEVEADPAFERCTRCRDWKTAGTACLSCERRAAATRTLHWTEALSEVRRRYPDPSVRGDQ